MKLSLIFIFSLFYTFTIGQISGIVKDSISNKVIPYVNIWVEGEEKGTTSDETGYFQFPKMDSTKILIFSAIAYESKRIATDSKLDIVFLKPVPIVLKEAVVSSTKKDLELLIGKFKKSKSHHGFACRGKPWVVARYFPFKKEYSRVPFLKTVTFLTRSDIKRAKFNIRLYKVNEKGEPGDFLFDRNIIGIAKKRKQKTEIDLSIYKITFPEGGLFIAIEWLIIESNKYEYVYTREGSRKKYNGLSYEPSFGAVLSETFKNTWTGRDKNWRELDLHLSPKKRDKNKFLLPAMELTLSN